MVNLWPETDPETEDVAIDHATCTGPSGRVGQFIDAVPDMA